MAHPLALANRAWESLVRAHSVIFREFADEPVWDEHELTMREYDVLYALSKCPGPARIGDLRENVLLSQPALSRMVDRLEQRQLVERVPDPTDRRAVRVRLSDAGAQLQRTIGRRHVRTVTETVGGALTQEELAVLERLTRKLADSRRRESR